MSIVLAAILLFELYPASCLNNIWGPRTCVPPICELYTVKPGPRRQPKAFLEGLNLNPQSSNHASVSQLLYPYALLPSTLLPLALCLPILSLLILLPTPQHLQMPRLLRKQLLRLRSQTRARLLLDLVLRYEGCFFRLDDARAALRAGGSVGAVELEKCT